MTWKVVNISNPGTSIKFGADDTDKINKGFSGIDVDDYDINSDFLIRSSKLRLGDSDNSHYYLIVGSNLAANRNAILPLLVSSDQFTFDAHTTTLSNKTLDATCDVSAALSGTNVALTNATNDFGDFDNSFKDNRLRIWNPADTFRYTIIGDAITGNRNLNLPLINSTDTLASLGLAQTFSAAQTFSSSMLKLRNPADTFSYTIVPAAIVADRNLILPLITGTDTLASLGLGQTFTGNNTFSGTSIINTPKLGANARILPSDTNQTAERTFTYPDFNEVLVGKGSSISNPYVGSGTNASLYRTGIWHGIANTNADGILSNGATAVGTVGSFNDTTEGPGRAFATGAVANNNAGLRWAASNFRREWGNYMILRVSFSSTSDIRVFIGWSSDQAEIAGETTLNNFSGVGVGKRTGDTNWFTYANDGDATEDRADTGVAFATTAVTIQLALDGTSFRSKIGTTTNTAVTTEIPGNTTMLGPHVEIETGAGAADKTINILPIWVHIGGVTEL